MGQCNGLDMNNMRDQNNYSVGPSIKKGKRQINIIRKKDVVSDKCQNNSKNEVNNEIHVTDLGVDQGSPVCRREKREVSPSSSVGSGGSRLKKKWKETREEVFEGVAEDVGFNQGKGKNIEASSKKKIGRRSLKKAMELARKTGMEGLGEDREGISDAYKEFYEEASDNNGVFQFGYTTEGEVNSKRCNISIEQLKEVGELIGVSWVLAEEQKKSKVSGCENDKDGGGDVGSHI